MELLLDDQKTRGGVKGLYTFPFTYAGADKTEMLDKEHTTEEPKEEKPSLDHIRARQNRIALARGLSTPFGEADSNLSDILGFRGL